MANFECIAYPEWAQIQIIDLHKVVYSIEDGSLELIFSGIFDSYRQYRGKDKLGREHIVALPNIEFMELAKKAPKEDVLVSLLDDYSTRKILAGSVLDEWRNPPVFTKEVRRYNTRDLQASDDES